MPSERGRIVALLALAVFGCGNDNDATGGIRSGEPRASGGTDAGGDSSSGGASSGSDLGVGGTDASSTGGVESGGANAMPDGGAPTETAPSFCAGVRGPLDVVDVWSDARGPFVLLASVDGTKLFHQEAGAWQGAAIDVTSTITLHLRGFSGGDLLLFGDIRCGIVLVPDGGPACQTGLSTVSDVFVVSKQQAYASSGERILQYDGDYWTDPFGSLTPTDGAGDPNVKDVWANEHRLAAIVGRTSVARSTDATTPVVDALPASDVLVALWGKGGELWAGSRSGQVFHFDEALGWSQEGSLVDRCGSGIDGMRGIDGTLFAYTPHQIVTWANGTMKTVQDFGCDTTIRGVWGTDPNAVYVATTKDSLDADPCGPARLYVVSAHAAPL